jgi:hypothetical protein
LASCNYFHSPAYPLVLAVHTAADARMQAEMKKKEKYERKLAQARAMISKKCDVYSRPDAVKSPPMPSEVLNKHNRLHFKHDLDSPVAGGELSQERNRLHTRHLPGEKVVSKEKTSHQSDVVFVNGATYVNGVFSPTGRSALSPCSPSLNDSALNDEDEDVPGISPVSPARTFFKPSKSGEMSSVCESLLGPDDSGWAAAALKNETPKERKKREKYERDLAKARQQIARLPGYNGTTPPPRSVTPTSAKTTPTPPR